MNAQERAVMQQALEALYEETAWFGPTPIGAAAITALRAVLAQQPEPVQEPVAWMVEGSLYASKEVAQKMGGNAYTLQALYTAPPQQTEPAQEPVWVKGELPPRYIARSPIQPEPAQEPIGYLWPTGRHPEFRFTQQKRDGVDGTPVYTHPPQRPPLTDEEMLDIIDDAFEGSSLLDVARAIERKVRGEV